MCVRSQAAQLNPRIARAEPGRLPEFAWRGLRRFRNAKDVADRISERHKVSRAHKSNVYKQALQIRYSLVQAEEYFEAAQSVSEAIRPTLLYYSLMSLAIAEILWKQTGESSLDAARSEHGHHGLIFKMDGRKERITFDFPLLRAKPFENRGIRVGTFELWHRTARYGPLVGELISRLGQGSQKRLLAFLYAEDQRMPLLPSSGLSLLDCIRLVPGMHRYLSDQKISPATVRGKFEGISYDDGSGTTNFIAQPGDAHIILKAKEKILFRANDLNAIEYFEFPSGFSVSWKTAENICPDVRFPEGFSVAYDEVYICPEPPPLNEFGLYYV